MYTSELTLIYLATTRTLSNASKSPSLPVVVAERLDNPELRVEERDDLGDVDSLAALEKQM